MVKLNKIYTRTGDGGETGLVDGSRTPKHAPRIAAIGDVDEANSAIGIARLHLAAESEAAAMLGRIQNEMFDLGADLATPEREGKPLGWEALRIVQAQVDRLEQDIDQLNAELSPLTSFILPAGSPAATYLHLARTVCRRAERVATRLAGQDGERVSDAALKYLNRLSDLLFVMARYANGNGTAEVLWRPGATR